MINQLPPKQVARALGVSEASVKRWCDKGVFETARTVGGHRRVSTSSVLAYLRAERKSPALPQVLGLPELPTRRDSGLESAAPKLQSALESADEESFRATVFGLFLAGVPLPNLLDDGVAPAYEEIGRGWEEGRVEVYQERRTCEIGKRILQELRSALPPPHRDGPSAFGGTLSSDPYTLASTMAELTLRELGWSADSFGPNLPGDSFSSAIERERPRLVWICVSHVESETAFVESCGQIFETAERNGVAVVVGGPALSSPLTSQIRFSACCGSMRQLSDFARALYARPPAGPQNRSVHSSGCRDREP